MSKTKDELAIGVDLGATNLKVGVVDSAGRVIERRTAAITGKRSADAVISQIRDQIADLKGLAPGPVRAVGLGVPGIVDVERGVIVSSPNYPGWADVAVRDEIGRGLGLRVAVDNDANMHALAEARLGAGKGRRNMVLLTLGTGIGGGLILDGKIFHGDCGFAGEVGHIVVEPDGDPCGCGGRGCWERYAASRAFVLHAKKLPPKEREDFLSQAGCAADELTAELVTKLADGGNGTAKRLWETYGRWLGLGIATLLNVLGVETFVIGGGIANSWDRFSAAARESALSHTYAWHKKRLDIKRAILGDDAGISGAAMAALEGDVSPVRGCSI